VVNIISGASGGGKPAGRGKQGQQGKGGQNQPAKEKTPEEIATEQQKRFEAMRARLLTQDARVD
jgi:hypothetical protein